MALYSLLILTKSIKKSKNNFKAQKKTELVLFPGRILSCKQNKSAVYSISYHIFPRLIVRIWGNTPAALIICPTLGRRHQHVAQCCGNIQPSFRYTSSLFALSLDSWKCWLKYFFIWKFWKNKNMICGIHYFFTKLKTKIDAIPRSCFNKFSKYSLKRCKVHD